MVQWWTDWKMLGAMPFDGDALDQPAYVVDVLRECERVSAEVDERQRQEREREPKKQWPK